MTPRELLRVGFILLGAFLIVDSLGSLLGSLNQRPLINFYGDEPVPAISDSIIYSAVATLFFSVFFGVLPGLLLIFRSEHWSHQCMPASGAVSTVPPPTLLAVGLLLLGIYLAIWGAAELTGGVFLLVYGLFSEGTPLSYRFEWKMLGSSLVYLLAGGVLINRGRRLARNAA
jgi:ABC-type Fe3+ transport system permease subunit